MVISDRLIVHAPVQWEGATRYPPYAFGGSHVLSMTVLRWWAEHPDALEQYKEVWMEDVALGLWFGELARSLKDAPGNSDGRALLLNDARWLLSPYGSCVPGALAMNANSLFHTALYDSWAQSLQACGRGCGCADPPLAVSKACNAAGTAFYACDHAISQNLWAEVGVQPSQAMDAAKCYAAYHK